MTQPLTTTLNKIRAYHPCSDGWAKLLTQLGKTKSDDEPLTFLTILDANGLADTIWCMRSAPEYDRQWRLFAVWCARQVQHLMSDPRSIAALDVAERYANGLATDDDLSTAHSAAYAAYAASAAYAARCAADSARSAYAAARENQIIHLTNILQGA